MRRLLLLALFLPACSATPMPISIDVTAGQETTAFADAGVTAITVTVTSLDGTLDETLSGVSPDGGTFDFGNVASSEQICVAATGYAGTIRVMSGQTLTGLLLSAIPSDIPVFLQQTGQWARPTGGLSSSHVNGVAAVVGENDLLITGGTAPTGAPTSDPTAVDGYDLFALGGEATAPFFTNPPPLTMVPFVPTSSQADILILLLGDAGASWLDYSTLLAGTGGALTVASLPTGLSSADVAGGALVNGNDGTVYVVGAARSGPKSNAVLEVDAGQTFVAYTLHATRQGAATTFVSGLGLVVAGGSETATGVEVPVVDGTSPGLVGMYPPDPTAGAGAVTDGENGFYLVGGTLNGGPGHTRHFILPAACTSSSCMPVPIPGADIPVALQNVSAYQLAVGVGCSTTSPKSTGTILVVGEGAAGTLSFVVDPTRGTVTAVPLREPRRGATTIPAPTGTLALVGGEHLDGTPALSIELFAP